MVDLVFISNVLFFPWLFHLELLFTLHPSHRMHRITLMCFIRTKILFLVIHSPINKHRYIELVLLFFFLASHLSRFADKLHICSQPFGVWTIYLSSSTKTTFYMEHSQKLLLFYWVSFFHSIALILSFVSVSLFPISLLLNFRLFYFQLKCF